MIAKYAFEVVFRGLHFGPTRTRLVMHFSSDYSVSPSAPFKCVRIDSLATRESADGRGGVNSSYFGCGTFAGGGVDIFARPPTIATVANLITTARRGV